VDFGKALNAIKNGGRVTRSGWNGKGMFLYLVPGSTFQVNRSPLLGIYPRGTEIRYLPHIDMRTVDGSCAPWLASQADLLADDWAEVIDEARCCDMHNRNCEPPSELCCENCTEARHAGWTDERGSLRHGHPRGEACSNPDLSGVT
jgi:hypothetical protein